MQFATPLYGPRRVAKCSTVFVNRPSALLLGHSDDWTQNWRARAAWISGRQRASDGSVLDFGNVDISGLSRRHGSDSKQPRYRIQRFFAYFRSALRLLEWERLLLPEASSRRRIDDAIARAADIRVTTAMSYNIGSTSNGKTFSG